MSHRIPAIAAARPLLSAALIALLAAVAPPSARAEIITVTNGNFNTASTNGTASGLFAVVPGTKALGNGWSATYFGPVASPTLAINSGVASISGVGLLNGGYFSQTLSTVYKAQTTYTLTATLSSTSLLSLGLLGSSGVGIGLTDAAGNLLASSASSPLVSLTALSGTSNYEVSLTYTTGSTVPSGGIGIRLFDTPGLLTNPTLLGNVTFDNVGLVANDASGTPSVPEPASVAMLGLGLLAPAAVAARRRRRAA